MRCPRTEQLEAYALAVLCGETRDEKIHTHISTCMSCREDCNHFFALHSEVLPELDREIPERIVQTVDRWVSGQVTDLRLSKDLTLSDKLGGQQSDAAADSSVRETEEHLKQLGVFVSDQEDLLVRLVYDKELRTLHVHIIAEKKEDIAGVKVVLGEGEYSAVSDISGHLLFSDMDMPEPDQLAVKIIHPFSMFRISLWDSGSWTSGPSGHIEVGDSERGQLKLLFNAEQSLFCESVLFTAPDPEADAFPVDLYLVQNRSSVECSGDSNSYIPVLRSLTQGELHISVFAAEAHS